MKKPRILFMGTPQFAKIILQSLVENQYNVIGLVCQPDREIGRKRILQAPPSKEFALEKGIAVFQPLKISSDYSFVYELKPDLIITCAYGQFVPTQMLKIPALGSINLHASLLPLLRGGAPIQHAILKDYKETGITLMQMVKRMDAGVMYAKLKVTIDDDDTYDSLSLKLQEKGKKMIVEYLPKFLNGELEGIPQNEEEATFGYNISREEEQLDFTKSNRDVFNHVRGLCSIPGAYFIYNDSNIKVYKCKMIDNDLDIMPGTIFEVSKNGIFVKCGKGAVSLIEIQIPGKSKIEVSQYMNGNNIFKVGTTIKYSNN